MGQQTGPAGPAEGFETTPWIDVLGGFIARYQRLWTRIGNLETRLLEDELSGVRIDRPIYVAGLARSGSTILLELLARQAGVVSHRYRDYPPVFTPYMWNRLLERTPQRRAEPAERSHKDGIKVTPDSPEALEEVLWMAFFPQLHDPAESAVLDRRTRHPGFESFYRDHIRKLLRVRGGRRYLAKGNYNVTRLAYLHELFADARFVIPVREPRWHIASLIKQHKLFCAGGEHNPAAVRHLQRVGHFEFGLDRRPVNAGDRATIERILACWQRGDEVEGWALYWSHIYGHVADRLEADPELRAAALVVRYEDLCQRPTATLQAVLDHVGLAVSDQVLAELAGLLHFPGYYQPRFAADELATIDRLTEATAARYGYGVPEEESLAPASRAG